MGLKANSIQSNNGGGVSIKAVSSIAELRATTNEQCIVNSMMIMLIASVMTIWNWDANSTAADNGTTVIKPTTITTGRWVKAVGDFILPQGHTTDNSGINADRLDGYHANEFMLANADIASLLVKNLYNKTSDRNLNTEYTNTTGKEMVLIISFSFNINDDSGGSWIASADINGDIIIIAKEIAYGGWGAHTLSYCCTLPVKNGNTYKINSNQISLNSWHEYY